MKLLIGGSPCTHWSIAKKKGRETEPEGQGWELFQNYKIALVKFRPDYFLYENNNSISAAIKERITLELGVEPIRINSELVSAQSRERIYWTNIPGVQQPEDCGIMLRDVLESGVCWREKSYTLRASAGPHQGMSNIICHCAGCDWCKSLEDSAGRTIYFCMNADSTAYLEETGLLGDCTFPPDYEMPEEW